ncbi:unnamed protein product [Fusarium graminearum]|nr:unnamed protein product [Fusarium graminearum]
MPFFAATFPAEALCTCWVRRYSSFNREAIPGNRKTLQHHGNRPDDLTAISQMGNPAPLNNKLALPGRSFGLNTK